MRTREEFIAAVHALVEEFKTSGRIVIVGASLAGLRAAEALRAEGFRGHLTIIGDEPQEPYDRPPLSKQVLEGWVPADHTTLPRQRAIDAEWRLGVAATGLDRAAKVVRLAHGEEVPYDRVTEFKYLTGQIHPRTTVVYEYPVHAGGDPYYPVPRPQNAELYRKYKELADDTPGVHFVGRLATYQYYNMDQVTAQALTLFDRLMGVKQGARPAGSVLTA